MNQTAEDRAAYEVPGQPAKKAALSGDLFAALQAGNEAAIAQQLARDAYDLMGDRHKPDRHLAFRVWSAAFHATNVAYERFLAAQRTYVAVWAAERRVGAPAEGVAQ